MKHITRRMMIGLLAAAVLLALFARMPAYAQTGYALQIAAGDNQSAPIATAFASPLQVTVTDGAGAGVAGVVVSFAVPASGPGIYTTDFTQTTDANGLASATVTANQWAGGPYEVVASIEGASVTFHLTNTAPANPNALESYWMADPLDPGRPAPAPGTPPETQVPGWWWRDTTDQNALSQHTADQFTGQVIHAYHRDPDAYNNPAVDAWVYSSRAGSNVTLIMTAHKYMLVGCGGGGAEALAARSAFLNGVPGFGMRTSFAAVLPDLRPDSYWGCKKWNLPNIYVHKDFYLELDRGQLAQAEQARRTAYADGLSLEWGPQGNVGTGWAWAYSPTDPASRPPENFISYAVLVQMEGLYIALAPIDESAGLAVYLPPAIGDDPDPYFRYGRYPDGPDHPETWSPRPGGAVMIVGDTVGSYLTDEGSLVSNRIDTALTRIPILDRIRLYQPTRLVMEHGLPIVGQAEVDAALGAQRDALEYVYDQTLAGIDAGVPESEIAATLELPPELAANPYNQEFVSTIPGVVRNIYHYTIGWFGGETPELAGTLTTGVKAQVLADAYGGTANLIAAARTAELNARDLAGAEKALYLAYAAYKAAPDDFTAKQVYAQALRKNAYLQKSAPIRNYYLTEALNLGAEQIVTSMAKSGEEDASIAFAAADFAQHYFGISGAALKMVKITSLPPAGNGVLTLAGAAVVAGQEIPVAGLDGLVFTPAADWNGSTSFAWNGKDGGVYCTQDASVAISILPVNDAPAISATPLADVNIAEDAESVAINLSAGFADVDGETLAYTIENDNPGLVGATLDGAILTLDLRENQNGAAIITVTAADAAGLAVTDAFDVTVAPVNDAPWANGQDVLVTAGIPRIITLGYGDVETAQAALQVAFSGPAGTLDTSALPKVTYTAPTGFSGEDSFSYTVSDGNLTAQATVTIHVVQTSIAGKVVNDANGNGQLETGEAGLPGVTVQLKDASDNVIASVATGADGSYAFGSLTAGVYRVRLLLPTGYVQTTPDPADITLADGQAVPAVDFGIVYSADLKVTMTASVNNKAIIYAITVVNDGPAAAAGATLTDVLPDTVSYLSVITTQGTCTGGKTVRCSFGTLAPGSSATVTLKVNRVGKQAVVNTATVTSSVFDIHMSDNSATATVP